MIELVECTQRLAMEIEYTAPTVVQVHRYILPSLIVNIPRVQHGSLMLVRQALDEGLSLHPHIDEFIPFSIDSLHIFFKPDIFISSIGIFRTANVLGKTAAS